MLPVQFILEPLIDKFHQGLDESAANHVRGQEVALERGNVDKSPEYLSDHVIHVSVAEKVNETLAKPFLVLLEELANLLRFSETQYSSQSLAPEVKSQLVVVVVHRIYYQFDVFDVELEV